MTRLSWIYLCSLVSIFLRVTLALGGGSTEVELPSIVRTGSSPIDSLQEDPVLPSLRGQTSRSSGGGALGRDLLGRIPLPFAERGSAGALSQVRGLGQSSEEVNVQSLGIPLNGAQGGGFDFSLFPQFLWSSFRFQNGPSFAALDPRGVAGTLSLVPWTAEAIEETGIHARSTLMHSSIHLSQLSAAVATSVGESGRISFLAGQSLGRASGPTGSLSARAQFGRAVARFHVLATDLDVAVSPPIQSSPSSDHQLTSRVIPVAQLDLPVGESGLLKSSVFYDWTWLRYGPPAALSSRDRIQQWGLENALLWSEWRFGLSARRVSYRTLYSTPSEDVASLSASRAFETGVWLVEPSAQLVGVSRQGFKPQASLGARRSLLENRGAIFARASLSRRFPSLADRYYNVFGFRGNPALQPERDWTATIGGELKGEALWKAGLQAYVQYRNDSQASTGLTVVNVGDAWVGAATGDAEFHPWRWLSLSSATTLATSRVHSSGQEFPYLSRWTEILSLTLRPRLGRSVELKSWELRTSLRTASSYGTSAASNARLGGYGLIDLELRGDLWRERISAALRIENLGDRGVELIRGYPLPGRVFAVELNGRL